MSTAPSTPHTPTASDPLDILIAHNAWGNRVLLERCRPLTREQFHRDFPIGVAGAGGLHRTFSHILSAAGRWSDRIRGISPPRPALEPLPFAPPPGFPAPDARDRSIDELLAINDRTTHDLQETARYSREQPAGLASTITLKFPQPPEKGGGFIESTITRGVALTHVLTHGHYHRAQAMNILRRLEIAGVSDQLPDIDVVDWQEQGEMGL